MERVGGRIRKRTKRKNPWMAHVANVWKKLKKTHSYKQTLKIAKNGLEDPKIESYEKYKARKAAEPPRPKKKKKKKIKK